MGSPISPILATIVTDHLLDNVITQLPFELPFLYKYVDDIICAVPSYHINTTLNIFNSFNKHLQFTIETETDLGVPFLDTRVIRTENNILILDWYQKPTASGRYINYFSNHTTRQKYNTVLGMKNRITSIVDDTFLQKNLDILYKIFRNNGYPKHILKKLIYSSNFYDGPVHDSNNKSIIYKKLPFINGLTHSVISIFKDVPNINIAKYNTMNSKQLFSKIKDPVPTLYRSNVVYEIPCLGCQNSYIGQTSQWLKQRITQHK
uniref:Uncharacterized protein LOC114346723 n=1 Tax=Diabrotica virgifera virgifera TaxID=50390 RepID=A0A6P7GU27_DIAVI